MPHPTGRQFKRPLTADDPTASVARDDKDSAPCYFLSTSWLHRLCSIPPALHCFMIDFADSCFRHMNDGDLLRSNHRHANADYHFGLAAECGLKRIMIALGMPVTSGGPWVGNPSERLDRVHMPAASQRFEYYRGASSRAAQFVLQQLHAFDDWRVEQRYWSDVHCRQCLDDDRVANRRTALAEITQSVSLLRLEEL